MHPRHDRHRANGLQDMQAIARRGINLDEIGTQPGMPRARSCDEPTVAVDALCLAADPEPTLPANGQQHALATGSSMVAAAKTCLTFCINDSTENGFGR